MRRWTRGRGRREYILAAAATAAAAGAALVGVAVAAQKSAPQPPASTARAPVVTDPTPPGGPSAGGTVPPSSSPRFPARATPSAATPTSISIPAIGVQASVVQLGLAADGSIEVPSDVTHVGWYRLGPAPGDTGPAVVLGHVDSVTAGPGVFFKLGALSDGDKVSVERSDGRVVTFTVYAVREYPKDDFPVLTVYGNTADPQLRLITCGGGFDRSSGHYRSNVVAFARETSVTPPAP